MSRRDRPVIATSAIERIQLCVIRCNRCPELREYTAEVARTKRRAYAQESYWGKPVPAFGDHKARLVIIGLAPGAHGSNRTGRMFTGDASGEWLYRALFRAGFANQPNQRDINDGLVLRDAIITAAARCAPPGNKPTRDQLQRCRSYLEQELALLKNMAVVVCLGKIATDAAAAALKSIGFTFSSSLRFAHGGEWLASAPSTGRTVLVITSYHPSRQNTNTGVLTEEMLDSIFRRAREAISV